MAKSGKEGSVMNSGGMIFMVFSWVLIIALNAFCFSKILGEQKEKIVGPLEVEAEMDEEEK